MSPAGTAYTDSDGRVYPNSGATIILLSGAGTTYSGLNISGSTLASSNNFRGAEAAAGTQINLTGLTSLSIQGTGTTANALRASGGSIKVERAQLTTSGPGHVVDVSAGGSVDLGIASTLNANSATSSLGFNLTGAGSSLVAQDLTVNAAFRAGSVAAGTALTLSGTGNSFNSQGPALNVAGGFRIQPGGSAQVTATGTGTGVTVTGTGVIDVANLNVDSGGNALVLQGTSPANIGTGSRFISGAGTGIQSTAAGATINGAGITASGTRGIVLGANSSLNLAGANTISGSNGIGLTLGAGSVANLGLGSTVTSPSGNTAYGISLADGASIVASKLDVRFGRGVTVSGNGSLELGGTGNRIAAIGDAASSHGINLAAGANLRLSGAASISTVNGNGINVAGNATNTSSLALDSPLEVDANGHGINSAANLSLDLQTGSVILATGHGINAVARTALDATDLSIETKTGGAGGGIVLGAGSVAHLGGTTRITTVGTGITLNGAAATVSRDGVAHVKTTGTGIGLVLNGGSADLSAGSSIRTETGMGVRANAGGTLTASNLNVVTNASQQNLVAQFLALPQYPEPARFEAATHQSALDAYAIASPATGLNIAGGTATLRGSTTIAAGGHGIVLDALSSPTQMQITGPLSIQAGPGGDATTSIVAVNAIRGAQLAVAGDVSMQVDSVGGGGIRSSSGSEVTLDVRASGQPLRISMVSAMNAPVGVIDSNETAALHSVAGNITVRGDARMESWQARGYGLWNHDLAASAILMDGNTSISTHGREAIGIRMDEGTMRFTRDLSVVTGLFPANDDAQNGSGSIGIRGIAGGLQVDGSTTIETHGAVSVVGVDHVRESAFGVLNTSVSRNLPGAASMYFAGPVQIQTFGNGAHGIYNDSTAGSIEFAAPVRIATSGGTDSVTWQRDSSGAPVNETIGAWGVNAALSGTTTFRNSLAVTTAGDGSGGVRSAGGLIDLQGETRIATAGAAAHGVYATGVASYAGRVQASQMLDVATTGAGAHALLADGNGSIAFSAGARLRVGDASAFVIRASDSASIAGSGLFDVAGNMQSSGSAAIALSMAPSSTFTGTTTQTGASRFDLTLMDSRWNMTGNSSLGTLVNDPSLIAFAPPAGGAFKTLTVTNYVGQGGGLLLNTYLGGDGSRSDQFVINGGAATGHSTIAVRNAGGPGAETRVNGIQVVSVLNGGTTQQEAFSLSGRAVAGAYEYQLYRGSKDASDPQGWYLRSEQPDPPAPPEPPAPPAPPAPLYRPEVGAYLANQRNAAGLFVHSLHDRLGEPQWTEQQGFARSSDKPRSGWLRITGKDIKSTSRDGNFHVDSNQWLIQAGGDVAQWSLASDKDRLHLGAMLGYGGTRSNASATGNSYSSKGKTEGWNLGVYGTWYQNNQDPQKLGWYADLWGTYGAYRNTVAGDLLEEVSYGSSAWTFSAETGYALRLGDASDWIVEPQIQVASIRMNVDTVTEANGTEIVAAKGSGWIGRLGVRTHRTWLDAAGNRTQAYLTVNYWADQVDNDIGFNQLVLKDLYPAKRWEAKLGLASLKEKGWSYWGSVGYQWGSQDYRAAMLRVGVKRTW